MSSPIDDLHAEVMARRSELTTSWLTISWPWPLDEDRVGWCVEVCTPGTAGERAWYGSTLDEAAAAALAGLREVTP